MPVVKPFAIFFLLTVASAILVEHKPLSKLTWSPGVWLVTHPSIGERVLRQTSAASKKGIHPLHVARGPFAVGHLFTGTRRIELVAGPILLVEVEVVLALALRPQDGVVEGDNVPHCTRTPSI